MTERFTETKSFNYANQRITDLLIKLRAKGVCGCCTGRAMMYHATTLSEAIMGSAEAIEMLEEIITAMHENNIPAPDHEARH